MSTINLAEAADRLVRIGGRSEDEVRGVVGDVVGDRVEPVPVDLETTWRAAHLRALNYDGRTAALSLADCVALALSLTTPGPCSPPPTGHCSAPRRRREPAPFPCPTALGASPRAGADPQRLQRLAGLVLLYRPAATGAPSRHSEIRRRKPNRVPRFGRSHWVAYLPNIRARFGHHVPA